MICALNVSYSSVWYRMCVKKKVSKSPADSEVLWNKYFVLSLFESIQVRVEQVELSYERSWRDKAERASTAAAIQAGRIHSAADSNNNRQRMYHIIIWFSMCLRRCMECWYKRYVQHDQVFYPWRDIVYTYYTLLRIPHPASCCCGGYESEILDRHTYSKVTEGRRERGREREGLAARRDWSKRLDSPTRSQADLVPSIYLVYGEPNICHVLFYSWPRQSLLLSRLPGFSPSSSVPLLMMAHA